MLDIYKHFTSENMLKSNNNGDGKQQTNKHRDVIGVH